MMGLIFIIIFFTFLRVKKSLNKIKPWSPKENKVDTYGAPAFATNYYVPVFTAKVFTNPIDIERQK
jgi:hypothetical protein